MMMASSSKRQNWQQLAMVSARVQVLFFILGCCLVNEAYAQRIAVIGGGISGTFVSRYLTDLDPDCSLEALTIFDPLPLGEYVTLESSRNDSSWQGSRVSTLKLEDGRVIELGASILSEKFWHIKEMAQAGNLTFGEPFATGVPEANMMEGMVIYNGRGEISLNTANTTSFWKKFSLLWRYNWGLFQVSRAMTSAIQKFDIVQEQLGDSENYVYDSPMEMWRAVGLDSLIEVSLDEFCDGLWVRKHLPWWRRYFMYGQGSLREELLTSINLVNYNQDNSQINAMTGLSSFSVSSIKTFCIAGGNIQLISSAFDQAQTSQKTKCPDKTNVVSHVRQRISTVVGSLQGFELYAEDGSVVGEYDIVILATPLPMARVDFLVKSHMDGSVLQPMPLGGLVQNKEDAPIPEAHEGHSALPHKLPAGATRPYTQVVTTILRDAELQTSYFSIDPEHTPRGIYMTPQGKALEHNVTAISQISSQAGLYKVFSSQPLTQDVLASFFGPSVKVEFEKMWGGPHGGATPDYQGKGDTTGFLLYDGATGFHGHTKSGALYYPNALELTLACTETSAMGAKAVAKLIAHRLEWITPTKGEFGMGEEL
jgi:prenylcysteine oxidase/farnesylcysteine lyase